ncbi:MAG TPA: Dabb family protein [Nevskia sp.]|nr:Dabb family protein [Nevskia sp.]
MNRIDLIRLRPGARADEGLVRTLRQALPDATQVLLRPTLPGVYNGGDLLLRLGGIDAAASGLRLPRDAVDHVDSVTYAEGEGGGDWNRPGVYRALLLAVKPAIAEATVRRFERELLAMPRYIAAIRAWRLSRVAQASGARSWTHVWEQRYDDLDGLTGEYMMHPYHWARVDRWFDPESPDWIVDTHLCHSFCPLD